MVNFDLPSSRRRLFVFIVCVTIITLFNLQSSDNKKTNKFLDPSKSVEAIKKTQISKLEKNQTEQLVREFIKHYVNTDKPYIEQKLLVLRPLVTEDFYYNIQVEAEQSRPVLSIPNHRLSKINKIGSRLEGDKIVWLMNLNLHDQTTRTNVEKSYELKLTKIKGIWLIEEVMVHGTFD